MNERIKLLSEQAEEYADEWFKGEPTWSEAFESKFAELIVAECIEKIESNYVAMVGTYPGACNSTVRKCVVTVKEHFGVKE